MTEETIIFEQDGNIVGITKEGKYFESYKTTENVAILRGAGLYIKRLEQENKELKEKVKSLESEIRQKKMTIMMNNDHYLTVDENNRKYRSALEEIREILLEHSCADTHTIKYITTKINEVLNEN